MTSTDGVIVAGHWISALNCVSVSTTVAVQVVPALNNTGSAIALVNGGSF